MRCTHCGANIPDDQLICPVCGAEVQIVPDYNPLEDVLAREVKGSVAALFALLLLYPVPPGLRRVWNSDSIVDFVDFCSVGFGSHSVFGLHLPGSDV